MNKNYETPDIIGVKALDNYLIYLKYETNEERIYDKRVKPRGDSIEWENGEDVDSENLYYDSVDINEFQGIIKELD